MNTNYDYRSRLIPGLACGLILGLLSATSHAQDDPKEPLTKRMLDRFEKVHELRTSQKVGEGEDGILKVLVPPQKPPGVALSPSDEELLSEENDDRNGLYRLLANETHTSADKVGRFRAALIREKLGNGPYAFWFQKPVMDKVNWIGPARKPGDGTPDMEQAIPRYVLAGPGATMFEKPSATSTKVEANLGVFEAFRVSGSRQQGDVRWFRVEQEGGASPGWLQEKDVLRWDHRLVARYANRQNRGSVVFFKDSQALTDLGKMDPATRNSKVGEWRKELTARDGRKPEPDAGPVQAIGIEPEVTPDQKAKPYMMPILNKLEKGISLANQEADAFEIASCGGEDIGKTPSKPGPGDVKADIVFVMDTTGSMQPYLDSLLNVAREATAALNMTNGGSADRFKFGFMGYQDDPKKPGIQYLTKNFTPDDLQDLASFSTTLSGIRANRITPDEYPEEVLAGMADAIDKMKWRKGPEVIKLIIQCGDAPPLASLCGLSADGVRSLADESGIKIISLHVLDPEYKRFHAEGRRAFTALATNPGGGLPAYFGVPGGDMKGFESKARSAMLMAINQVKELAGETPVPNADPDQEVVAIMKDLMEGAVIDYRGRKEPGSVARLQRAWTLGRDPTGRHLQALEPCVVLNKTELDNLFRTLKDLSDNVENGDVDLAAMRDKVAAAIIQVFRDPKTVSKDLEADLKSLPIHSNVMSINNEMWVAMTPLQRMEKLSLWNSYINYYQSIYNGTNYWFKPNANSRELWAAIRLDMFP